jgi:hypothetical protein
MECNTKVAGGVDLEETSWRECYINNIQCYSQEIVNSGIWEAGGGIKASFISPWVKRAHGLELVFARGISGHFVGMVEHDRLNFRKMSFKWISIH